MLDVTNVGGKSTESKNVNSSLKEKKRFYNQLELFNKTSAFKLVLRKDRLLIRFANTKPFGGDWKEAWRNSKGMSFSFLEMGKVIRGINKVLFGRKDSFEILHFPKKEDRKYYSKLSVIRIDNDTVSVRYSNRDRDSISVKVEDSILWGVLEYLKVLMARLAFNFKEEELK